VAGLEPATQPSRVGATNKAIEFIQPADAG